MLTNEAATADAEAVPPVPVAPGLAEVAVLVADREAARGPRAAGR